jgi:RimJ/RimL family protein N-acetyltransferase
VSAAPTAAPQRRRSFPNRSTWHGDQLLTVREMQLENAALRIDYFLGADPGDLLFMGVDPRLLPSREDWLQQYVDDFARERDDRRLFGMVLQLDGQTVGFSNVGLLDDEASALVHFHLTVPEIRGRGLGARFLRMVTNAYFAGFDFDQLYFEPNAFNTASNRMAQSAGYRFLRTHRTTPGAIHLVDQPMTRWVIRRADFL